MVGVFSMSSRRFVFVYVVGDDRVEGGGRIHSDPLPSLLPSD